MTRVMLAIGSQHPGVSSSCGHGLAREAEEAWTRRRPGRRGYTAISLGFDALSGM